MWLTSEFIRLVTEKWVMEDSCSDKMVSYRTVCPSSSVSLRGISKSTYSVLKGCFYSVVT